MVAIPQGVRDRHKRGTGCGGRGCAFDERRVTRTAKSCGPDASTLASSSWEASFSGATVAKEPDHRGEHEVSRKTIARGMPGVSGVTVVPNAGVTQTNRGVAGHPGHRH